MSTLSVKIVYKFILHKLLDFHQDCGRIGNTLRLGEFL